LHTERRLRQAKDPVTTAGVALADVNQDPVLDDVCYWPVR
jgi:hypothetical protein